MRGIPTTYRGVRFRSRLEARWACMFDRLDWPWQYEPFDLNGYVPDFVLPVDQPLLVEVKPAVDVSQLDKQKAKIDVSGWDGEVLIVGAALWELDAYHPVLGVFREGESWSVCRLVQCINCGHPTPVPEDLSWRCRVCSHGLRYGDMGTVSDLSSLLAESGNRVQWRP